MRTALNPKVNANFCSLYNMMMMCNWNCANRLIETDVCLVSFWSLCMYIVRSGTEYQLGMIILCIAKNTHSKFGRQINRGKYISIDDRYNWQPNPKSQPIHSLFFCCFRCFVRFSICVSYFIFFCFTELVFAEH